jgi:hypothetical protein
MRLRDHVASLAGLVAIDILAAAMLRIFERSPLGALPESLQGPAFLGMLFIGWVFWRGLKDMREHRR